MASLEEFHDQWSKMKASSWENSGQCSINDGIFISKRLMFQRIRSNILFMVGFIFLGIPKKNARSHVAPEFSENYPLMFPYYVAFPKKTWSLVTVFPMTGWFKRYSG